MNDALRVILELIKHATPTVSSEVLARMQDSQRKIDRLRADLMVDPPPVPGQRLVMISELFELAGYEDKDDDDDDQGEEQP
jgi:hypothetical protein